MGALSRVPRSQTEITRSPYLLCRLAEIPRLGPHALPSLKERGKPSRFLSERPLGWPIWEVTRSCPVGVKVCTLLGDSLPPPFPVLLAPAVATVTGDTSAGEKPVHVDGACTPPVGCERPRQGTPPGGGSYPLEHPLP